MGMADDDQCDCLRESVDNAEIATLQARVDELTKALKSARVRIEYLGVASPNPRHFEANERTFLPAIDAALSGDRK